MAGIECLAGAHGNGTDNCAAEGGADNYRDGSDDIGFPAWTCSENCRDNGSDKCLSSVTADAKSGTGLCRSPRNHSNHRRPVSHSAYPRFSRPKAWRRSNSPSSAGSYLCHRPDMNLAAGEDRPNPPIELRQPGRAIAFCECFGGYLPAEGEWQYAATRDGEKAGRP